MDLEQFTGTENYYKHFGGIVYTDGIKYLAEVGKCYWLIDLIVSYQPKLRDIPFQLWAIRVFDDKTARITCREDSDLPELIKRKIGFTSFPLEYFECYCIDGVLLLKSEY